MLAVGRVIERYAIEGELGSGGMATVYRVRHTTLGSAHALKVLKVHSVTIQERLAQEGRVQAALHHPNIVAVTDVIDVDGVPGLVMEFVDGPTLENWLVDNRPDLARAEAIFRAILSAVSRAHRHGLVHRDLKPGNVLLDVVDDELLPKVTDFGLAKILADEQGGISQTRAGIAMGTPAYMSPEQVRDTKSVDQRADIFALGAILYELVTGTMCFRGKDTLAIFNAVGNGTFVPPGKVVPGLPARISNAIEGCLEIDRERRIQDCATLKDVLAGKIAWGQGTTSSADLSPPREPTADEAPVVAPPPRWTPQPEAGTARVLDAALEVPPPAPPVVPLPEAGRTFQTVDPAGTIDPAVARPRADSIEDMSRYFDDPVEPAGARSVGVLVALVFVAMAALAGAGALALFAWHVWSGISTPAPAETVAVVEPEPVLEVPGPPAPVLDPEPRAPAHASEPATRRTPRGTPRSSAPAGSASSGPAVEPVAPPAPAPVAPTVAAQPVAPAEAPVGQVDVIGDAERVVLRSLAGDFAAGPVPAGTYEIRAQFPGRTMMKAGQVVVTAGGLVKVHCDSAFAMCRVR